MENHHAFNGKIHYNWPFSIAMLNYQRVNSITYSHGTGFCPGELRASPGAAGRVDGGGGGSFVVFRFFFGAPFGKATGKQPIGRLC